MKSTCHKPSQLFYPAKKNPVQESKEESNTYKALTMCLSKDGIPKNVRLDPRFFYTKSEPHFQNIYDSDMIIKSCFN